MDRKALRGLTVLAGLVVAVLLAAWISGRVQPAIEEGWLGGGMIFRVMAPAILLGALALFLARR